MLFIFNLQKIVLLSIGNFVSTRLYRKVRFDLLVKYLDIRVLLKQNIAKPGAGRREGYDCVRHIVTIIPLVCQNCNFVMVLLGIGNFDSTRLYRNVRFNLLTKYSDFGVLLKQSIARPAAGRREGYCIIQYLSWKDLIKQNYCFQF